MYVTVSFYVGNVLLHKYMHLGFLYPHTSGVGEMHNLVLGTVHS
jgi:hypothetical protein